ncbi:hypothetical protein D3C85_827620 [compost metagenome]
MGNVLSGSARNKETLDWLEKLFGKVKQMSESLSIDRSKTSISLSEKLEHLIPSGKIASLKAGELVGMLAADTDESYNGSFSPSVINCKVNLNLKEIEKEESLYPKMPIYYDFKGKKEQILSENFQRINAEVAELISRFPTG